ncbi:uncharacterized protein LOC108664482 [Hyalella azteca]|uniref:Glycosyltransferase family 92 protein n=1 Tax=Hyalella azteca TaxID=294128 RepID=A0A8B7N023_HYAAZ|nr:uncharacterized protein LOC108664482 [Hyalella azteca]
MTSARVLFSCLILVTALSCLLILYLFLYLSSRSHSLMPTSAKIISSVNRPSRAYQVISNSEIKTRFDTLQILKCHEPPKTSSVIEKNNKFWQVVKNRDVFLYSAFYDVRYRYEGENFHFVRIIATARGALKEGYASNSDDGLMCHFWFPERKLPTLVIAELKEIWIQEFHSHPPADTYHSYLISCPVPHEFKITNTMPSHVSVSTTECDSLSNFLPVQKEGLSDVRRRLPKRQYLVCVKGLNFIEDISYRLIEWVELILILGATKIDFYVYHVHEATWNVLRYYEATGVAQIISMTLPGDQPNEPDARTRYLKEDVWQKRRNELVTYNDCLYRNMYLYNFIIPLDIDEVPVPVQEKNWSDMFHRMFKSDPFLLKKYSSFSAPNSFFFTKWNQTLPGLSTESNLKEQPTTKKTNLFLNIHNYREKFNTKAQYEEEMTRRKFHMLNHRMRSTNFSRPGHNIKSFVSTKNTLLTFNHYSLYTLLPSLQKNLQLNSSIIQLNHYQEKCSRYILSECISTFDRHAVADDIILKYSDQLKIRVEKTHRNLLRYINNST